MNKLFSPFFFFIILFAIVLGSVAHLMYGHCQTSKVHFMLQYHYMPDYLPKGFLKNNMNSNGHIIVDKNYTGKWSVWYKNGVKFHETQYIDGIINGKQIVWNESGAKEFEAEYKDGAEHGKYIRWHENGVKVSELEYKFGKLNGKSIWWDNNGKKRSEAEYKDGEMNGKVIFLYNSGAKKYEAEYIDGKLNGKVIWWDETGKKISEEEYKEDAFIKDYLGIERSDGTYIVYWANKNKMLEIEYKGGLRNGRFTSWSENGDKEFESKYKDGVMVSE